VRRVDTQTGEVLEKLEMPPGVVCRDSSRRGRSVLLRRRKERKGEGRPPTQASSAENPLHSEF